MLCCNKEKNKYGTQRPMNKNKIVENKVADNNTTERPTTIDDFWSMFQKAVEKGDKAKIISLIKIRDDKEDSLAIGIQKEEIEGLINSILYNDIKNKILTTSVYGLKKPDWNYGIELLNEKRVFYISANAPTEEFGIILFFGEFDGEYRLFHYLIAG